MEWWEFLLAMFILTPIAILWVGCMFDIFRREDLPGVSKVLWLIGIILLPLLGPLIYLLVRPRMVVTETGSMDDYWTPTPRATNRMP
jgi:hypothetical protein